MLVLTKPEDINAFRLLALRGALKLEIMGLRRKGQSVATRIKNEFKLKGKNQQVYEQFEALLREKKVLV